jgi:hypothetical protein
VSDDICRQGLGNGADRRDGGLIPCQQNPTGTLRVPSHSRLAPRGGTGDGVGIGTNDESPGPWYRGPGPVRGRAAIAAGVDDEINVILGALRPSCDFQNSLAACSLRYLARMPEDLGLVSALGCPSSLRSVRRFLSAAFSSPCR